MIWNILLIALIPAAIIIAACGIAGRRDIEP